MSPSLREGRSLGDGEGLIAWELALLKNLAVNRCGMNMK